MLSEEAKGVLADLVDVRSLLDLVPVQHLINVLAEVRMSPTDPGFMAKAEAVARTHDELLAMVPTAVENNPVVEVQPENVEPVQQVDENTDTAQG